MNESHAELANRERNDDPRTILHEIIRLMGFEVEVEKVETEETIGLTVSGAEAGHLIGKKGQTLDALQFVMNKIMGGDAAGRKLITVDAGGYRERRREALTELARRLGEEVARTGKAIAVNPMSAHDRRIIHLALKEKAGITTRSEGEGAERRLLVVPDRSE
jgi:spoIIIJ-associated protein